MKTLLVALILLIVTAAAQAQTVWRCGPAAKSIRKAPAPTAGPSPLPTDATRRRSTPRLPWRRASARWPTR